MIEVNLRLRPAVSADQQQIADLILFEQRIHRHLDWRGSAGMAWISAVLCVGKRGRIVAALACPPDPPSIFWIRLFAFDSNLSGIFSVVAVMGCGAARINFLSPVQQLPPSPRSTGLRSILIENRFASTQNIVMLEWNRQPSKSYPVPAGITVASDESVTTCHAWWKWMPRLLNRFGRIHYQL